MSKQKIALKEISRFPSAKGLYLATLLGIKEKRQVHPFMFYIQGGRYSHLRQERVVRLNNELMRVADFKQFLKDWIEGESDVYFAYHKIV